jgi:hypothetical protein
MKRRIALIGDVYAVDDRDMAVMGEIAECRNGIEREAKVAMAEHVRRREIAPGHRRRSLDRVANL